MTPPELAAGAAPPDPFELAIVPAVPPADGHTHAPNVFWGPHIIMPIPPPVQAQLAVCPAEHEPTGAVFEPAGCWSLAAQAAANSKNPASGTAAQRIIHSWPKLEEPVDDFISPNLALSPAERSLHTSMPARTDFRVEEFQTPTIRGERMVGVANCQIAGPRRHSSQ